MMHLVQNCLTLYCILKYLCNHTMHSICGCAKITAYVRYTCCSCTFCTAGPVPADLIDDSGAFQLVLEVDDTIQQPHWRQRLRMPRRLLALLAVQCLLLRDEGASHVPACIHCCGNWCSAGIGMLHSTDVLKFCTGLTAIYGGHDSRIVFTCSHLFY
jgi:hypothetical protein